MYRTVAELDIRLGGVSVQYGYRDMYLRAVTEVVRPLSFVSCLVSGEHTGCRCFRPRRRPRRRAARARRAGGIWREAGLFPSPTKLERNGLTGTELGAEILISVFPVLNQGNRGLLHR